MNSNKHTFAFYLGELAQLLTSTAVGDEFVIKDKLLASRMLVVIRVAINDHVILFDEHVSAQLVLTLCDARKNYIVGKLQSIEPHVPYKNNIVLYQCLTQKTAFEEIVYTATQMGVARIIPVISAKVQRKWGGEHERERLRKVMIAAAEQSKSFQFPWLEEPKKITDLQTETQGIFFSIDGSPLLQFMRLLSEKTNYELCNVLIGAEGGLTDQEESTLKGVGWKSYQLTPTILRAVDAAVLGLGSIRSIKNI